jgi:hypothetical protein
MYTTIKHFKEKPRYIYSGLTSMGPSLDAEYYTKPNVTFSLLRKIARKK